MDVFTFLQKFVIIAPAVLIAITFHEAAHGFVANYKGDPTARVMGRLTLNPLAHIDLFGTVALPALFFVMTGFIFGYAKPVPVNFQNLHRPRTDMIWVAVAGPGINLVLALLSGLFLRILITAEPDLHGPMGIIGAGHPILLPIVEMLKISVLINIVLMVFNLLPIPPLDGGRVMVGLLPDRQAGLLSSVEPYGFFIILFLLFLDPTRTVHRVVGSLIYFFSDMILGGIII